MAKSVYDEYALALDCLNLDSKTIYQNLIDLNIVLKDKDTHAFFSSPNISVSDKKEVIRNAIGDVNKEFIYFLYVLIDNERLLDLDKIILSYEEILNQEKNILTFTIESAYKVKDDVINKIKNVLKEKYRKDINIIVTFNKDIIGGIILKQKGKIIDDSILNKLELLKESLKEMRN